jgi:hypothetical protein
VTPLPLRHSGGPTLDYVCLHSPELLLVESLLGSRYSWEIILNKILPNSYGNIHPLFLSKLLKLITFSWESLMEAIFTFCCILLYLQMAVIGVFTNGCDWESCTSGNAHL